MGKDTFIYAGSLNGSQRARTGGGYESTREVPSKTTNWLLRLVLANPGNPDNSWGTQCPHIHTHTQDHSENENHTQPPNQHQSEYEIQTQGQHGNGPTNETPSSVNTPMTRAKVSLGTGSLSRTGGEGGVGGLGSALRRSVGQDLKRQLEVQKVLAEVGVAGDVQRELYQRKDITAAVVRRIWSKVQKCKDIDDPVAVLVHRLRNYRG